MLDALDRDTVVLRYVLESAAAQRPDTTLVTFEDGTRWTSAEALRAAYESAHELRRAGVEQGSVVAIALPNGEAYLRAWWGASVLGAAVVPVNTAHRGPMLRNLMHLAQPHAVVADGEFRSRLVAAAGDLTPAALDPRDLHGNDGSAPVLARPIEPWDAISLAPTSGSTGPSKLVRVSHAQSRMGSEVNCERFGLGVGDILLADTPMVHVSALYFIHASIGNGIAIAVRSRPALDAYWEVARDTDATICQLYSTMITHLEAQPRRPAEREHSLRYAVTVPLPPDPEAFRERFGIAQLGIGYGLTEVTSPISLGPTDPLHPGSIGTLRTGFQVRLVDEHDVDVPPGSPGEAIVRSDTPWLITTEYVGNPEATATAWRNGWFHTGDLLRRDEDGTYFYVDRLKDSIRRRGQNVSSFEVESVVRDFPGIADVAVVAERGDVAVEDEIKAWLVTEPGAEIDFVALLRFCVERLAHYMVPRYFEIAGEFPRTASAKVRKAELRERGTSALTWDRLAHGIDIRRTGLVEIGAEPH